MIYCIARHGDMLDLQGKEPWNKGQRLSQETRDNMSAAKLGHKVPRQVCTKMSLSHTGLRHSEVCTLDLAYHLLCSSGIISFWISDASFSCACPRILSAEALTLLQ